LHPCDVTGQLRAGSQAWATIAAGMHFAIRSIMRIYFVVAMSLLTSTVHANPPTQLVGQVVDAKHVPVDGATVRAGSQVTHTNVNGLYRIQLGSGEVPFTVEYGGAHASRTLIIADAQTTVADVTLAIDIGEVIHVEDRLVAPVGPKPLADPGILPRYSDEAIVSDTWARAWILLDIDERGSVTRVKWLKRPGHDLDKIAIEAAIATKFEPARDQHDRPKHSLLVHLIEWPSYWWLVTSEGMANHRSYARNQSVDSPINGSTGLAPRDPAASLPCYGSGPLNLDRAHPVYKDCTPPPDPRKFDKEPWIVVGGSSR
jgi:hypothetical protein